MDTRTGRIVELTEEEDAKLRARIERGERTRLVPIPTGMLLRIQRMKIIARKRWARGQRRRLREMYARQPHA